MGQYHPQFVDDSRYDDGDSLTSRDCPGCLESLSLTFMDMVIDQNWPEAKTLHEQIRDF
jgi:hypothetical protein